MSHKRSRTKYKKYVAGDNGASYARRPMGAEPDIAEERPLTIEEHRAQLREEMEKSRDNIRKLRERHDRHLREIGEKRASVN
jgi:predicted  nucleic acid-binding Zn-ribbon protein